MENELLKAYAEVDVILSLMENTYVEKIPKSMIELFKKEKLQGYKPNINPKIPLDEQNLQKKTYAILAMLNLNYWCENEKEKQKLLALYSENDKKREAELRKKYNPDNLFNVKELHEVKLEDEIQNNTSLIKYEEKSLIKRIINRIMRFFKF